MCWTLNGLNHAIQFPFGAQCRVTADIIPQSINEMKIHYLHDTSPVIETDCCSILAHRQISATGSAPAAIYISEIQTEVTMDKKVNTALQRLDAILPLLSGLQSLSNEDATLYCWLLNSYVEQGRTLTREEVAGIVSNVEQALSNLVASKLIVVDEYGNPAGAYPFTSQQREHQVARVCRRGPEVVLPDEHQHPVRLAPRDLSRKSFEDVA